MGVAKKLSFSQLRKRYLKLAWQIFLWNLIAFVIVLLISPIFGDPFVIFPLVLLVSVLLGTSIGIVIFQHKATYGKRSRFRRWGK